MATRRTVLGTGLAFASLFSIDGSAASGLGARSRYSLVPLSRMRYLLLGWIAPLTYGERFPIFGRQGAQSEIRYVCSFYIVCPVSANIFAFFGV